MLLYEATLQLSARETEAEREDVEEQFSIGLKPKRKPKEMVTSDEEESLCIKIGKNIEQLDSVSSDVLDTDATACLMYSITDQSQGTSIDHSAVLTQYTNEESDEDFESLPSSPTRVTQHILSATQVVLASSSTKLREESASARRETVMPSLLSVPDQELSLVESYIPQPGTTPVDRHSEIVLLDNLLCVTDIAPIDGAA